MTTPGYRIVAAEQSHLPQLGAIELAAAQLLRGHAPAHVLGETTEAATFARAAEDGRLWVAVHGTAPVGFALVSLLPDGLPHLEEIDVHPVHGRRGLGTALVRAACEWASVNAHRSLSLTTFRAPLFNMPFYDRLGFRVVDGASMRTELAAVVANETVRGLPAEARVVMEYDATPMIRLARADDGSALFDIWRRSARATHAFVSAADFDSFEAPVRAYLAEPAGELWVLCSPMGRPLGFMGLAGHSLESLFLAPECLRKGFGRRLVAHARQLRGALTVEVNEQNHDAVAFYRACGFASVRRSEFDGAGRPYPLLLMRTETAEEC